MKFLEPRRNVFRIWLLFLLRNEMKEKIIHDDSVWCHGIQLMQAMCLFIFRDVVKSLSHRTQQVFVESISNILSTYSLTFTQKFVKLEFYFWLFSVRVCIWRKRFYFLLLFWIRSNGIVLVLNIFYFMGINSVDCVLQSNTPTMKLWMTFTSCHKYILRIVWQ